MLSCYKYILCIASLTYNSCIEQGKLLGVAWKALEEGDKTEWNDKAAEDKLRYKKEMEDYTPPSDDDDSDDSSEDEKPKKKKAKKDPNAPKNAKSGKFGVVFIWILSDYTPA